MHDISRQDVTGQVLWYWVPVALYAGTIFYLSHQPHPDDNLPSFLFEEFSDKFLHAVEYSILALLCYRAFRWGSGPVVARQAVLLAIVTASVYGMTDEVHQAFIPFRESGWEDWLADTIGATIGVVGWRFLDRNNLP
jgi:VanZ family protein